MLSSVFSRGMPALAASAAFKAPGAAGGKLRTAPSPSPVPPLFPGRYLVPMQIVEGFGAWSDGVWEMFDLAMQLNRTLVEPCVRNGCIEPCRCGHVRAVPPYDPSVASSGADPLLLPYIDDPCKIDGRPYKRPKTYASPSYPLSAYIDMEAVKAKYPPGLVVPYQEWCEAYNTTHADEWDAGALRWRRPRAWCGDMQQQYCDGEFLWPPQWFDAVPAGRHTHSPTHACAGVVFPCPRRTAGTDFYVGDFVFDKEVAFRSDGDGTKALQVLQGDDADTVFIWRYYRALFQRAYSMPSLPVNPWHVAAVKRFIAERMGSPDAPFLAFHWRSEHVKDEDIVPCAHDLANISAALPHVVPVGPGGGGGGGVSVHAANGGSGSGGGGVRHFPVSHAILVADMPAPNTKNVMWTDYVNGKGEARHQAMQALMEAGASRAEQARGRHRRCGLLPILVATVVETAHLQACTSTTRRSPTWTRACCRCGITSSRCWRTSTSPARCVHVLVDECAAAMRDGWRRRARLPHTSGCDGRRARMPAALPDPDPDPLQGDHYKDCHGCFRAGSNIVFRIVRDRREANKPSRDKWFSIGPADVPPAPP